MSAIFTRFQTVRLLAALGVIGLLCAPAPADASPVGFYTEAEIGYGYANLRQFRHTNFLPEIVALEGSGYTGSAAAGVTISIGAIGARFAHARYEDFALNTFSLEGELRATAGPVRPFARLLVGVGWLGEMNISDIPSAISGEMDVYGWALGLGVGLDIALAEAISLGAGAEVSLLNLTRQEIGLNCAGCGSIEVGEDGDALGLQVRATLRLSLRL